MKFDKDMPVKIVMLGAGGTGGHIATHLYRLLFALNRPSRFIICDGDLVEEKNLVRQNFTPAELGMNKARVLAERYSGAFGMECEYIPEFIEDAQVLSDLVKPREWYDYSLSRKKTVVCREIAILIGAVDNQKSRQMCHHVFMQSPNLIYIDSGNGLQTGQVVCGIRSSGKMKYSPLATLYPDVMDDVDKFPTELSCAEASVSAPQSIMANVMAATTVLCMVYNILAEGENLVHYAHFSSRLCSIQSELEKRANPKIRVIKNSVAIDTNEEGEKAA